MAPSLREITGADLVASFGATLHVSGHDGERLQAALGARLAGTDLKMTAIPPSLEDAFIYLMQDRAAAPPP